MCDLPPGSWYFLSPRQEYVLGRSYSVLPIISIHVPQTASFPTLIPLPPSKWAWEEELSSTEIQGWGSFMVILNHSLVWTDTEANEATKQENFPKERTNPHREEVRVSNRILSSVWQSDGFHVSLFLITVLTPPPPHLISVSLPLYFPLLSIHLHVFLVVVIMMSSETCSQHFYHTRKQALMHSRDNLIYLYDNFLSS